MSAEALSATRALAKSSGRLQRWASAADCGRWRPRAASIILLAAVAAALLAQVWPAAAEALEFDRQAMRAGEWWRPITGQFVHFGWPHALSDLGTFLMLCRLGQRRCGCALLAAGVCGAAVALLLCAAASQVETYRGISGIGYGLLAWTLVRQARQDRCKWSLAGLGLLTAKVLADAAGLPLLPHFLPPGVAVAAETHAAGMVAGSLLGLTAGSPWAGRLRV